MAYFLWLYLANIFNRFRVLAGNIFRLGLLALAVEYLILAQHSRPIYYTQVMGAIEDTWLILLLAFIMTLLPSQQLILNILSIKKYDKYFRDSLLARILRLVKYSLKYGLLNRPGSQGSYERVLTPKRLKFVFIGMYIYDLFMGYKKLFVDFGYLIFSYFSFACATWLYVKLTGASIYYINIIDKSFAVGIALIGFLILKILFFPDWKTLRRIAVGLIIRMVSYKLGLFKLEDAVDKKIANLEAKGEAKAKANPNQKNGDAK